MSWLNATLILQIQSRVEYPPPPPGVILDCVKHKLFPELTKDKVAQGTEPKKSDLRFFLYIFFTLLFCHARHSVINFEPVSKEQCAFKQIKSVFEPNMAFKIPCIDAQSLTKAYFRRKLWIHDES